MTMDSLSNLESKSDDYSVKSLSLPPVPVEASEGGVRAWCTLVGG